MAPFHTYLGIALAISNLVLPCEAGLQVPLTIINFSPFNITVSMTGSEKCIKHDFGSGNLKHYYNSWRSTSLREYGREFSDFNPYLQWYKSALQVADLGAVLYPMSGTAQIQGYVVNQTATPFAVFEAEIDGGVFSGCAGRDSYKRFSINVEGTTTNFELRDPARDHWTLSMLADDPNTLSLIVDIGHGGHASVKTIAVQAIFGALAIVSVVSGIASMLELAGVLLLRANAWAVTQGLGAQTAIITRATVQRAFGTALLRATVGGGTIYVLTDQEPFQFAEEIPIINSIDDLRVYDFYDVYRSIERDDRSACIMGHNIAGNYDCLVAGTSIVIQGDGSPLAVPLPNVYRAWK